MATRSKKNDLTSELLGQAKDNKAAMGRTKAAMAGKDVGGRPAKYDDEDPRVNVTVSMPHSAKKKLQQLALDEDLKVSELIVKWVGDFYDERYPNGR